MGLSGPDLFEAVTPLGDGRYRPGLATLFVLYLYRRRQPAMAAVWLRAPLVCLAVVLLSKIAGHGLTRRTPQVLLVSPSGDVALATLFHLSVTLAVSREAAAWMPAAKLRRVTVNPERNPPGHIVEIDETSLSLRIKDGT
jgi:hypothetical protein